MQLFIPSTLSYLASTTVEQLEGILPEKDYQKLSSSHYKKRFERDHFLIVVDQLFFRYLLRQNQSWEEESTDELSISLGDLSKRYTIYQSKLYCRILRSYKVLSFLNIGAKGKGLTRYRLSEEHLDSSSYIPVTIDKKIKTVQQQTNNKLSHLSVWLQPDLSRTTLDEDQVGSLLYRSINDLQENRELMLECLGDKRNLPAWIEALYAHKVSSLSFGSHIQKELYRRISLDCPLEYRVDGFAGRLHTPFTNLLSELKQSIQLQDPRQHNEYVDIIGCDIKNSQPYFSLTIFDELSLRALSGEKVSVKDNVFGSPYFGKNGVDLISRTAPLLQGFDIRQLEDSDVLLYKELVTQGTFYEYLTEHYSERMTAYFEAKIGQKIAKVASIDYGGPYNIERFNKHVLRQRPSFEELLMYCQGQQHYSRRFVKEQVFTSFFAKNSTESVLVDILKEDFPTVYQIFHTIKSGEYYDKKKKKEMGHNLLAKILQSVESFSILGKVSKEIHRRKSGKMPMITMHDSIGCPLRDTEYVKERMEIMLEEVVGHRPTVRIESKVSKPIKQRDEIVLSKRTKPQEVLPII